MSFSMGSMPVRASLVRAKSSAFKLNKTLVSAAVLSAISTGAHAAGTFEGPMGIEGRWGMEVTVGTAVRTKDADASIVARGNGGQASSGTVDDGNLNFSKGDVFSTVAKAVGEVEIRKDNYGAFFRAKAYSDLHLKNASVPHGSANNAYEPDQPLNDDGFPDGSKFEDVQLLEAFGFADFYPGDKPLTVKFGNQVVTWGEALFVLGGVNQYSNFDAAALRRPGAQLKEVFLPLPQVYANFQATDELSIEAFAQLNHEKVSVDGCGTLFSPADLLNCGNSGSPINPGTLRVDPATLIGGPAGTQAVVINFENYDDRQAYTGNGSGSARTTNLDGSSGGTAALADPVVQGLLNSQPQFNFRMDEAQERRSRDDGQIGLAARYYAGEIGTEFGAYLVNYHQRVPNLSLISNPTSDPNSAFSGQGLGNTFGVTPLSYFFDWGAEDIQVAGFSAATEFGGYSVFGEISYTKDYPAAYNTVDLIKGAGTGDGPLKRYKQAYDPNPSAGQIFSGSKPMDKIQAQVSTIKLFPRVLKAASWAMVGEIGVQFWDGIEDPFTGERFGRSPAFGAGAHAEYDEGFGSCDLGVNPNSDQNGAGGDPRYCSTDGYATKTAAGYRLLFVGDYPSLIGGATIKPRIFFSHDFSGTSVDGVFLEDRKNLGLGLRAEIQSGKYFAETNYSMFDKNAFYDPFKDRDFVSLVLGANL